MQNKKTLPFVTTQMNLEDIMLYEISQTDKDKYCMLSLIGGILKSHTHRNKDQFCSYQA